ncbi:MAG: DUF2169 domain-containing protein [Polyangia bacterium]
MTIINLTNCEAAHAVTMGLDGNWQVIAVVKATYTWDKSGTVCPAPSSPIVMLDEFFGDPASSGLLLASDIAPTKPRLDVLLAGAIAFPKPITEIEVGLAVGSRLHKRVRVFGDRIWLPAVMTDVVPSRPRPVSRVPIAWERSYGGADPADGKCIEPQNPAGSGVAKNPKTLHGQPAPNFENPDKAIGALFGKPDPVGFGPIAAHWQQRVALAGTYDEAWKKSRMPLPPDDFSPAFFNVAPKDQQLDKYLPGEKVRLLNMTTAVHDQFDLPAFAVPVAIASSDGLVEETAVVDTLTIEPEERRFSLLAKAQAKLCYGPLSLGRIVIGDLTRGMRSAIETGRKYPWLRVQKVRK